MQWFRFWLWWEWTWEHTSCLPESIWTTWQWLPCFLLWLIYSSTPSSTSKHFIFPSITNANHHPTATPSLNTTANSTTPSCPLLRIMMLNAMHTWFHVPLAAVFWKILVWITPLKLMSLLPLTQLLPVVIMCVLFVLSPPPLPPSTNNILPPTAAKFSSCFQFCWMLCK